MKERNSRLKKFPPSDTQCPRCGAHGVTTRTEIEEFVYGTGEDAVTLRVPVPVGACGNCGFHFTDAIAEQIKHEAICRHRGVHTPAEIVALRRKYDLSRSELARVTRIGDASLARWENGTFIQNAALDHLLYLLHFPENLNRLKDRMSNIALDHPSSPLPALAAAKPRLRLVKETPALLDSATQFRLRPSEDLRAAI